MAENNVKLYKYTAGYELVINGFPVKSDWTSTDKEGIIAEAQEYLLTDASTPNGYLSGNIVTEDLFITYLNDGTPTDFGETADRANIHFEDHS